MASEQREMESLAYDFWLERGQPVGSPEVDWFRAEQELWNRKAQDEQRTATYSHSEGGVTGGWAEEPAEESADVVEIEEPVKIAKAGV